MLRSPLAMTVLIMVVASLGFAGGQREADASDDGVTVVTFMRWGSPAEEENFRTLFDAFEAENPDVRVEMQFIPWQNYWDTLNVQLAAGETADIVAMTSYQGSKYYSDRFADLSPYLAGSDVKTDELVPGLLEAFTQNGRILAVPTDLAVWCMVYNEEFFDNAGLPYPSSSQPMTWDEFLDLAARFTTTNADGSVNTVGYADQNDNPGRMNFFMSAYGEDMFDALVDPSEVIVDRPGARRAVELIDELATVMPPVAEWGKQWESPLLNRRTAFSTIGPWEFPGLQEAGIQFGVMPIPEGVPDAPVRGLLNAFMIAESSEKKDAAWRVLEFVGSDQGQRMVASLGLGIPTYPDLLESEEFLGQYPGVDLSAYLYMMPRFKPLPLLRSDTFNTFVFDQYKNLMDDTITVDEFVRRVDSEGQEILDAMY